MKRGDNIPMMGSLSPGKGFYETDYQRAYIDEKRYAPCPRDIERVRGIQERNQFH
jgi:hypothetical protein